MAITGLILIGYLLAHMYGNLKIFAGPEAFNAYAHHLRTSVSRSCRVRRCALDHPVVLIVSVLAHMYAAFSLWSTGAQGARRR